LSNKEKAQRLATRCVKNLSAYVHYRKVFACIYSIPDNLSERSKEEITLFRKDITETVMLFLKNMPDMGYEWHQEKICHSLTNLTSIFLA
jgi:hypothetical protein